MIRHVTLATLAALILTPPSDAHAQASYGLMAGASLANVSGEFVTGNKNATALLFGGFARLGTDEFSIQPGLIYIGKGTKAAEEDGISSKIALTYLQVPVIARFSMAAGKTSRFYLGAGPALGLKLGCKLKGAAEGLSLSFDCEDAFGDEDGIEVNSTELSLIGETGLEFGQLSIGLRADLGMTNPFKAAVGAVDVEADFKTRTLSLVGAIRF